MRMAVVLSGCGVRDGAEIHEAVLTLLALDRRGVEPLACAPDVPQATVVDHLTAREDATVLRNVLVESARIARGAIRDLAHVSAAEVDGLVLPGGFGAARNLSSFAERGEACTVLPELERLLRAVHAAGKPIAAFCIAPVVLASVFGARHPRLTIGEDAAAAAAVERMGAVHVPCPVLGIVIDRENRFVTTPAYMLAHRIGDVAHGIERAIGALVDLAAATLPGPDAGRRPAEQAAARRPHA